MPTFRNILFHLHRQVDFTHIYLPMKMEQTGCSETLAYKIQAPGNYPKESIQHTEHGDSLKSRKVRVTNPFHGCTRYLHVFVSNHCLSICSVVAPRFVFCRRSYRCQVRSHVVDSLLHVGDCCKSPARCLLRGSDAVEKSLGFRYCQPDW